MAAKRRFGEFKGLHAKPEKSTALGRRQKNIWQILGKHGFGKFLRFGVRKSPLFSMTGI
ncbi:MAG: hypothetical protein ACLQJL_04975 [Roseiarcus sp.]